MQVRKQQLELDMEQQTSSKSEKEYVKAVYYHPAYLTYKQSDNTQPYHTPFPILNYCSMSVPCLVLTGCSMSGSKCSSLTYTLVSQEAGTVVWYSYHFKNFPVCGDPHSQKL